MTYNNNKELLSYPKTFKMLIRASRLVVSSLTRPQWLAMIISIVAIAFAGWLVNVPALIFGDIVDDVALGKIVSLTDVAKPLIFILIVIIGRELLILIRRNCVEWVGTSIEKKQFVSVIGTLIFADILLFAQQRVGALQKRVDRSVEGVVKLLKLSFLDLGPALAATSWALVLGFVEHFGAGLIMLGTVFIAFWITIWQVSSQKGIRIQLFRSKEDLAASTVEILGALDYMQSTKGAYQEIKRSEMLAEKFRKRELRHHRYMMSFDAAKQLTEGIGYIIIIAFGAWLVVNGKTTEGTVLKLALLFGAVATPLRELHRIIDEGFESILRVADLEELYNIPASPVNRKRGLLPSTHASPIIKCDELSVELKDNSKRSIIRLLQNVTFVIEPRRFIGCAGQSGSGKSTMAKAILGIIKPTKGDIHVFGQNPFKLDRNKFGNLIGYVPQSPFLIAGTLRENLLHGFDNKNVSEEILFKALSSAQCSYLAESKDGLDTLIAEGGRNLAGGEKQRIAISRIFVQKPYLIILDEATSALDANTEALVMAELHKLREKSSLFVIAHRLSTLLSADNIIVFKEGAIIEQGNFTDLLKQKGVFWKMAKKQGL